MCSRCRRRRRLVQVISDSAARPPRPGLASDAKRSGHPAPGAPQFCGLLPPAGRRGKGRLGNDSEGAATKLPAYPRLARPRTCLETTRTDSDPSRTGRDPFRPVGLATRWQRSRGRRSARPAQPWELVPPAIFQRPRFSDHRSAKPFVDHLEFLEHRIQFGRRFGVRLEPALLVFGQG